jgi:serine/threonine protein kinase
MLTEPLSPNLFPVGTLLDGKFRVMRCIGRGGMGAVYEILHVLTKHRRALKMLYPHVAHDRDAVDRFLREASATSTSPRPTTPAGSPPASLTSSWSCSRGSRSTTG